MQQLTTRLDRAEAAAAPARVMLYVTCGANILIILNHITHSVVVANTVELVELFDLLNALSMLGWLLIFIVTGILFIRWMRRAQLVTETLSRKQLEYSKWDVYLGFFIPLINLYKPKRVMDEIFDRAHPYSPALDEKSHDNSITMWWTLWIVQIIGDRVVGRALEDASNLVFNMGNASICLLQIAGALYCIRVIDEITELQHSRFNAAMVEDVFE